MAYNQASKWKGLAKWVDPKRRSPIDHFDKLSSRDNTDNFFLIAIIILFILIFNLMCIWCEYNKRLPLKEEIQLSIKE